MMIPSTHVVMTDQKQATGTDIIVFLFMRFISRLNKLTVSTACYYLCFSLIAEKAITARITAPAIIR